MLRKALLVIGNPNPVSYNHAILDVCKKQLALRKCSCETRDLYSLKFNPCLSADDFQTMSKKQIPRDIAEEQKWIKWSDLMILIYPIWWASCPAIVKGYIDRVFSSGFAYHIEKDGIRPGLVGKKIVLINTYGQPKSFYYPKFENAMKIVVDEGIFEWSGMKVMKHQFFDSIQSITKEMREGILQEIGNSIKEIQI